MTTFVLLHGIPGSSATWQAVAARLDSHEVLIPDLLGFGATPVPEADDALLAGSQAEHVLAFLDGTGAAEVVLVGHDFGGPVAAHLCALAPERVAAVALFATNAFPDTPVPFPLSMLGVPGIGTIVEQLLFSSPSLSLMVRRGVGRPRVHLDLQHYIADSTARQSIATIFAASLRRMEELYTPVAESLSTLDVPALVGWGDRDPFFPIEVGRRTAGLIPGSAFHVYQGAGHFLPEERPDDLARDLMHLALQVRSR